MDHATLNFTDFPEDIQVCILSFLAPSDIAAFACTSSRFALLCRSDKELWYAMCDRRWGGKTEIRKWGGGKVAFKALYRTLNEWEDLIGFWHPSRGLLQRHRDEIEAPALVLFEWGVSYLAGFSVSPGRGSGYGVVKSPFLIMGLDASGEVVNFLDPEGRSELTAELDVEKLWFSDTDLISVNVSFMGRNANAVMVEENSNSIHNNKDGFSRNSCFGSTEGRRKWGAGIFLKIVDCSPTVDRPLQGLWKADICTGCVTCRRVSDLSKFFPQYMPVFIMPDSTLVESPVSPEEEEIYNSKIHIQPYMAENYFSGNSPSVSNEAVSSVMHIDSIFGFMILSLDIMDLMDMISDSISGGVEGRVWLYQNGTFGFGFLRDGFVVDLKPIAQDGCLLDVIGSRRSE